MQLPLAGHPWLRILSVVGLSITQIVLGSAATGAGWDVVASFFAYCFIATGFLIVGMVVWQFFSGFASTAAGLSTARVRRDARKAARVNAWRTTGVDWKDAELLAAATLRQMGFTDARVTGSGADRGIDVLGSQVAAQVKYTTAPVGRPQIQQLAGAARGRVPVFFSRAGYSQHAVAEATHLGMALFTLSLDGDVSAMNRQAALIASRGADAVLGS